MEMSKHPEDYPIILEVSHIQEIMHIGKRQAYALVNSGQFRSVRIGRSIKIPKDSFFEWLIGNPSAFK
jgi:excisionase family DNA binding protein